MLLKVDFNEPLFRALFPILFDRVAKFAIAEGGTEPQVAFKFAQMLANEGNNHLLIDFDIETNQVLAHCMYTVQNSPVGLQIVVEQLEATTGHNQDFVKEALAYAETIPNATQICMGTSSKKYKAFQKKYGFSVYKVLMIKDISTKDTSNGE